MIMVAAVKILPPEPFCFCMPWHGRHWETATEGDPEPKHGARCCYCDREIAAPESARGKHVACIYCGLDLGKLPAVEIEP